MFKHPDSRYKMCDWWFYKHNGLIFGYYLIKPVNSQDEEWEIACATSKDLKQWEYQGVILRKGHPGDWDDMGLATGSVVRFNNRFYMAYTGHKRNERLPIQRTGIAVSDNLLHWDKNENATSEPDQLYYEIKTTGSRKLVHWRDPYMFIHDGYVWQIVCARKKTGTIGGRGTIGLSRSKDMIHWEILPPPETDDFAEELECPQIYHINGKYYLVFSTHGFLVCPTFKKRLPNYKFTSSVYCMVSDSPFGPFKIYGTGRILPESCQGLLYAGQMIRFKKRWYLLGTERLGQDGQLSNPFELQADNIGLHAVTAEAYENYKNI